MRSLVVVLLLIGTLSFAASPRDKLLDAVDGLRASASLVKRQSKDCQQVLANNIRQSIADIESTSRKRAVTQARVQELRLFVGGIVLASGLSTCPSAVTQSFNEPLSDLNQAWDLARNDDGDDDDRPQRRRDDDGDRDDDRYDHDSRRDRERERERDNRDDGRSRSNPGARLQQPSVRYGVVSTVDGTPAVEVRAVSPRVWGAQNVYYAERFRPLRGDWGTWFETRATDVSRGAAREAGTFNIRYSTLRETDAGDAFIMQIAVFDADTREKLDSVETRIDLPRDHDSSGAIHGGRSRGNVVRDCGTGYDDPGCNQRRGDAQPMDAEAFRGVRDSLKSQSSDFTRLEMMKQVVAGQHLTARQLAELLPMFSSDFSRLEAAKAAAPHVVDPARAIGSSKLFTSSFSAGEYVKVMSAQK